MFSQNQQHIINILALECKRQQSGEESVYRMLRAYTYLWAIDNARIVDVVNHTMIRTVGHLVEPEKNTTWEYRNVPVVFANGKSGVHHDQVPRAMHNLLDALNDGDLSAADFYIEFQKIHPFEDGNGRTGFLLYNFLKCSLEDLTIPPEIDWNK